MAGASWQFNIIDFDNLLIIWINLVLESKEQVKGMVESVSSEEGYASPPPSYKKDD